MDTSFSLPALADIEAACDAVYSEIPPTPQYRWALASQRLAADCWIKHENHTPVGAFKIRGGLSYFQHLARTGKLPREIVCATRGNHGQSVAWAARSHQTPCTIVVPRGNSTEKNAAMQALGAQLIEHGDDFQEAREYAEVLTAQRQAHMVPSFHYNLLCGVATYWLEFLRAAPQLDIAYVPIGQGSGICSAIAVKQALGHKIRIVGVCSAHAPTFALSLQAGRVVAADVNTQLADGLACRVADPVALEVLRTGMDHIVQVSDAELAHAMRALYRDTHNLSEGAGAASYAAALKERSHLRGLSVGVVISGANVDASVMAAVLAAQDTETTH